MGTALLTLTDQSSTEISLQPSTNQDFIELIESNAPTSSEISAVDPNSPPEITATIAIPTNNDIDLFPFSFLGLELHVHKSDATQTTADETRIVTSNEIYIYLSSKKNAAKKVALAQNIVFKTAKILETKKGDITAIGFSDLIRASLLPVWCVTPSIGSEAFSVTRDFITMDLVYTAIALTGFEDIDIVTAFLEIIYNLPQATRKKVIDDLLQCSDAAYTADTPNNLIGKIIVRNLLPKAFIPHSEYSTNKSYELDSKYNELFAMLIPPTSNQKLCLELSCNPDYMEKLQTYSSAGINSNPYFQVRNFLGWQPGCELILQAFINFNPHIVTLICMHEKDQWCWKYIRDLKGTDSETFDLLKNATPFISVYEYNDSQENEDAALKSLINKIAKAEFNLIKGVNVDEVLIYWICETASLEDLIQIIINEAQLPLDLITRASYITNHLFAHPEILANKTISDTAITFAKDNIKYLVTQLLVSPDSAKIAALLLNSCEQTEFIRFAITYFYLWISKNSISAKIIEPGENDIEFTKKLLQYLENNTPNDLLAIANNPISFVIFSNFLPHAIALLKATAIINRDTPIHDQQQTAITTAFKTVFAQRLSVNESDIASIIGALCNNGKLLPIIDPEKIKQLCENKLTTLAILLNHPNKQAIIKENPELILAMLPHDANPPTEVLVSLLLVGKDYLGPNIIDRINAIILKNSTPESNYRLLAEIISHGEITADLLNIIKPNINQFFITEASKASSDLADTTKPYAFDNLLAIFIKTTTDEAIILGVCTLIIATFAPLPKTANSILLSSNQKDTNLYNLFSAIYTENTKQQLVFIEQVMDVAINHQMNFDKQTLLLDHIQSTIRYNLAFTDKHQVIFDFLSSCLQNGINLNLFEENPTLFNTILNQLCIGEDSALMCLQIAIQSLQYNSDSLNPKDFLDFHLNMILQLPACVAEIVNPENLALCNTIFSKSMPEINDRRIEQILTILKISKFDFKKKYPHFIPYFSSSKANKPALTHRKKNEEKAETPLPALPPPSDVTVVASTPPKKIVTPPISSEPPTETPKVEKVVKDQPAKTPESLVQPDASIPTTEPTKPETKTLPRQTSEPIIVDKPFEEETPSHTRSVSEGTNTTKSPDTALEPPPLPVAPVILPTVTSISTGTLLAELRKPRDQQNKIKLKQDETKPATTDPTPTAAFNMFTALRGALGAIRRADDDPHNKDFNIRLFSCQTVANIPASLEKENELPILIKICNHKVTPADNDTVIFYFYGNKDGKGWAETIFDSPEKVTELDKIDDFPKGSKVSTVSSIHEDAYNVIDSSKAHVIADTWETPPKVMTPPKRENSEQIYLVRLRPDAADPDIDSFKSGEAARSHATHLILRGEDLFVYGQDRNDDIKVTKTEKENDLHILKTQGIFPQPGEPKILLAAPIDQTINDAIRQALGFAATTAVKPK